MITDDHKMKRMGSALKFLTRYAQKEMSFWICFHLFLHLKKRLAEKNFGDDDEGQEEVMTWFKGSMTRGYRSLFQDLINVWAMQATVLENKVM
jgi:hypothetical protein